jgi:hypothetical protein
LQVKIGPIKSILGTTQAAGIGIEGRVCHGLGGGIAGFAEPINFCL